MYLFFASFKWVCCESEGGTWVSSAVVVIREQSGTKHSKSNHEQNTDSTLRWNWACRVYSLLAQLSVAWPGSDPGAQYSSRGPSPNLGWFNLQQTLDVGGTMRVLYTCVKPF